MDAVTAVVTDPIYLQHDLPPHPENAERLRRIAQAIDAAGLAPRLRTLPPRPATLDELLAVHSASMIERVRRVAEVGGGFLDADTYVSPGSYDAALAAAGGTLVAVEAVLSGAAANAFALVRPPGHHATPSRSMGFCLFNNLAVAARAATTSGAVRRVFVADFDVHHGNGTQEATEADPAVFYFSMHQVPLFPGTGHWSETGRELGAGTVLNVPLPPGTGDAEVQQVIRELVWPLAQRFAPDLLLVSAGYDGHWRERLASLNLSLTGYAWLQRELVAMAAQLCGGRIVFALEGGYDLDVLAGGVLNALYAMLGDETVVDSLGPAPAAGHPIDDLIGRLRALHGLV